MSVVAPIEDATRLLWARHMQVVAPQLQSRQRQRGIGFATIAAAHFAVIAIAWNHVLDRPKIELARTEPMAIALLSDPVALDIRSATVAAKSRAPTPHLTAHRVVPIAEAREPEIANPTPMPSSETTAPPAPQESLSRESSVALPIPASTNTAPTISVATPTAIAVALPKIELPSSSADYLNNPAPPYPPISKRLREQGRVLLRVLVGVDGVPERVELQRSSGYERLDEVAIKTVRLWKFVAGKRGGVAEAMWVNVPMVFELA